MASVLDVAAVDVFPHRVALVTAESVLALAGAAGAWQLWDGRYAPPVEDIAPLGLTTWRVPAIWLFASVTVPSAVAAGLAYRRSPSAPSAVLVGSALLTAELVVQMPFVGRSPLQAVFGGVGATLAGIALHARRAGWPRR